MYIICGVLMYFVTKRAAPMERKLALTATSLGVHVYVDGVQPVKENYFPFNLDKGLHPVTPYQFFG